MVKLSNLLKWSKEVGLMDGDGNPIIDQETKKPVKVWLRILGDGDLQEAYRQGRIKSSRKRTVLRNPESPEYQDEVAVVDNAERDDLVTLILAVRQNIINSEASANVERHELPELEEFATDPDAPSLEEQEKLDLAVAEQEADYAQRLEDYAKQRMDALEAELREMDLDALRAEAKVDISNMGALSEFLNEVIDQKIWRGTFTDKNFQTKAFDNIDDFRSSAPIIKEQIRNAYAQLEANPEELKK